MKKDFSNILRKSRILRLESLESRELLAADMLLAASAAEAPSTVVTTKLDVVDPCDGAISLREAIGYADPGDAVTFDPSLAGATIVLTGTQLTIDKALAIDATALMTQDAPGVTVDAARLTRVFYVAAGTQESPVVLRGLGVVNGAPTGYEGGAGIILMNGYMTVESCTIAGNAALDGGGLYLNEGTLNVVKCAITGNSATQAGGGIYHNTGTLNVVDSEILGNTAVQDGGGLCLSEGEFTLSGSVVADNASTVYGGGFLSYGGTFNAIDSVFRNNASEYGGGLCNLGTTSLVDCVVSQNHANNEGGGLYNMIGSIALDSSLIEGNVAESKYGGGGIYNGDECSVVNCTIVGNDASRGSGIVNDGTTLAIDNSILLEDEISTGENLVANAKYAVLKGANNLSTFTGWTDPGNVAYIATQSLFADATQGDYRPVAGAQTIDAGNNGVVTTALDLDGSARVQNGTVDIGAYEYDVLSLDYDPATRVVALSWGAIPGAASYRVMVSRNSGTTWANLSVGESATSLVDTGGVYPGASQIYRVCGVDASGAVMGVAYEKTFAPVSVKASRSAYRAGDTIELAIKAAPTASYDLRWFRAAPDGDVEIADAAGRTSYVPEDASYPLKVVLTGTGNSENTGTTLTIPVDDSAPFDAAISFDYDGTTRVATLGWSEIATAASYKVRISKDGGASWTDYYNTASAADPTATTCDVAGLYAGKSYSFRVYSLDATGKRSERFSEGTFAPVSATASARTYRPGDTISLAIRGSDDATATIRWYYATETGDVEIEEARGALSFAPESAEYPIRVVVTGTGVSTGSGSETTIAVAGRVSFGYSESTRVATLNWGEVAGAASYKVRISRDGGATWLDYYNTSSATDPTAATCEVGGVYSGKTYSFRVYSYDAKGRLSAEYSDGTFAPVTASCAVDEYKAGDTIAVALRGSGDAEYEIAWYYATDSGDVEIEEARGRLSFAPESGDSPIRIVVTGTNASSGSRSELVVANAQRLAPGAQGEYDTIARSVAVSWNMIEGATRYGLQRDDGTGWKKVATIEVATTEGENGEIKTDVSGGAKLIDGRLVYTARMFNAGATGSYRVLAIVETGAIVDAQEFAYTSFGLELDHDAYNTAGDVLTASTAPETQAACQWYESSDAGATWTPIEGATTASLELSSDVAATLRQYKLVATSVETNAQSVVYARPSALPAPTDVVYAQTETDEFTLTFVPVPGATDYQAEYRLVDAPNPVWLNLTNVKWTTTAGQVVGTHVHAANYANYPFRIRAVDAASWSEWTVPTRSTSPESSEPDSNALLEAALADLFANDALFVEF